MLVWGKKSNFLSLCIRFFTSMLLTFLMFFEVCGALAVALLTPSHLQLVGVHRCWVHLQQLLPLQPGVEEVWESFRQMHAVWMSVSAWKLNFI